MREDVPLKWHVLRGTGVLLSLAVIAINRHSLAFDAFGGDEKTCPSFFLCQVLLCGTAAGVHRCC
jgi:hypothetical protein